MLQHLAGGCLVSIDQSNGSSVQGSLVQFFVIADSSTFSYFVQTCVYRSSLKCTILNASM